MPEQDAWRRRANLYGCASASRLPTVHVEPTDARVRRDLQLAVAWHNPLQATANGFEDEQNDRKHREQLGQRPPLDRLQSLQDLTATVPKDIRPCASPVKQQGAWRVGYNNHAHCEARAHPNGLFEPSDTMRERLALQSSSSASCLTVSRTISYPLTPTTAGQVAESMHPFDERVAREDMDCKTNVGGRSNNDEAHDCHRPPWSPNARVPSSKASPSEISSVSPQKQRFAVRSVATKPCSRARQTPQEMDGRCISKQQRVVAQANESFARIRKKVDRHKKAALRYSLPLEDSRQNRSYRLGLDSVPSSHPATEQRDELAASPSPVQPHKFRPKSAAATSALLGPSRSTNALEPVTSVGKVAGAKRRPHSASVCYLRNSTVYCLDSASTASSNNGPDEQNGSNPSDYQSLLASERRKRSNNQSQLLRLLAKKGMLSQIPMPQIFARLRREALVHLTRRQQHAMYEKMPLHDYMKTCGFSTIVANRIGRAEPSSSQPATDGDEDTVVPAALQAASNAAQYDFRAYYDDGTTPSIIFLPLDPPPSSGNDAALHKQMLVVNRQQCHIAMEPFSLSASDVNLLFSAVDIGVEDSVALWKILCAVATVQTEHAAMRRARVQHGQKSPAHLDEAFVSVLRKSLNTGTP